MRTIFSMAFKDLRIISRDRQGFFFTLIWPVIFAVFFGFLFSGAGGSGAIKVVIVDEDRSAASAKLLESLSTDAAFETATSQSREEATGLVLGGKRAAAIIIPKGYGEASQRIFWGDPMKLLLGVDPARKAEAGMIEGTLTAKTYQQFQTLFTDRDMMRKNAAAARAALAISPTTDPKAKQSLSAFLGDLDKFMTDMPTDPADPSKISTGSGGFNPVSIERLDIAPKKAGPSNSFAISFPQAIVWGLMGCAASFGISLVSERTTGTLVRLRMAPLTGLQILAGKGLACFITTLAVFALLITLSLLPPFNVRPVSWPLLILAAVCVAFGFVGIMMILSVLGKTERAASGIGWSVMSVMSMIGGGMVPLFAMPPFMQTASNVSPIKWSILAIEGGLWRGLPMSQMITPCVTMATIGLVGVFLGSRAMGRTSR